MKVLQVLLFVLISCNVYCLDQYPVADEDVRLNPKEVHKHVDPEIQAVFTRNLVPFLAIHPQTCADSTDPRSGVQMIHPQPGFGVPFEAFCDQDYDGGGWTVIQNRFDGSIFFYQDWNTYEEGFGNLNGEFWLGLRKIHELTNTKQHELIVLLEDRKGYTAYARYSHFLIANPSANYKLLLVGNYSGNAGDSLSYHAGMQFSTLDNENDLDESRNCGERYQSGWWFKTCYVSNLNGLYWDNELQRGMSWNSWEGADNILGRSRMMIRAKGSSNSQG